MLDKILIVNPNLAVIYYTHREPVLIHSDTGNAFELANELLAPFDTTRPSSYTQWQHFQRVSQEDTIPFPFGEPSLEDLLKKIK